jgi:two-component system, chemotaxis family, sensor kinase CheA
MGENQKTGELQQELSVFSTRLMLAEETDATGVFNLTQEFQTWLGKAAGAGFIWVKPFEDLCGQIFKTLEDSALSVQAFKRLNQAVTRASETLFRVLQTSDSVNETPGVDQNPAQEIALTSSENKVLGDEDFEVIKERQSVLEVSEQDKDSFKDLLEEAPEHLQSIEEGLLKLSQQGIWDPQMIFGPFHTLKGIFGFMGFMELNELIHFTETVLEKYKKGEQQPKSRQIDILLEVTDCVKNQIEEIGQGLSSGVITLTDCSLVMLKLQSVEKSSLKPEESDDKTLEESEPLAGVGLNQPRKESVDQSVRISVSKMDALLEAVGELAISQTQVSQGIEDRKILGHLAAEAGRLRKITKQLQDIVLSLRLVPVKPLFLRMSRLVHDLGRKTSKEISVVLIGEETELDKGVVEDLAEPMVHLIRNAVDHGIEGVEERIRQGKSPKARIILRAYQRAGDFVLEISDDGQGLDYNKLEKKGREKGLLKSGENSDPEKLANLIFEPGFSTAEKITDVSGRGVGMDAVRKKVQEMKGGIKVISQTGQGTTFMLKLPLTMALMDGVLVRIGRERYVLPAAKVKKFMALSDTNKHSLGTGQGSWLVNREEHIPLIDLKVWFNSAVSDNNRAVAVHVENSGKQAALLVDEVLEKQSVVVKGLSESLGDLKGVSGGAILGDGRVGLILDVDTLVDAKLG